MTELQKESCRVLGWIINRAIELVREKDLPCEQINAAMQEEMTKVFLDCPDNPFASREELSRVHSEALKASGEAMELRIKKLREEELYERSRSRPE